MVWAFLLLLHHHQPKKACLHPALHSAARQLLPPLLQPVYQGYQGVLRMAPVQHLHLWPPRLHCSWPHCLLPQLYFLQHQQQR
jgi:hypothetical protein